MTNKSIVSERTIEILLEARDNDITMMSMNTDNHASLTVKELNIFEPSATE